MRKYKKIIDDRYEELKRRSDTDYAGPKGKLKFLSVYIFGFATYDDNMDVMFTNNMIEVLRAILGKTTFEYIKEEDKYLNYLTMVNMPFLKDRLDWGVSIRGAWFTHGVVPKYGGMESFVKYLLDWIDK